MADLISIYAGESCEDISELNFSANPPIMLKLACDELYEKPIFISDNLIPTLEEFKATAVKMRFDNKIDILFVDSFE